MELSVLERQRAVLRRIYQDQFHMESDRQLLWEPHPHHPPNSTLPIPQPHSQCNSMKRKAEFDIEEEEREIKETEEKSDITTKTERETTSANTSSKESMMVQKPDYIHVRARRGQATDNHSLAERARREKISKKMKCLQDLVPGCNNVTGKAGMLDEIINYVQSLQKQVEFLSMKLATVNPPLDFSIDNLLSKEIMEATNPACFQYNPMQPGINVAMDQPQPQFNQTLSPKLGSSSLPIPEVFLDSSCISQLSGCESDWQNLFSAGFQ